MLTTKLLPPPARTERVADAKSMRAVRAFEPMVPVPRGRATPPDTVDAWLDRKQAGLNAGEAGAGKMNNHLRVRTARQQSRARLNPGR